MSKMWSILSGFVCVTAHRKSEHNVPNHFDNLGQHGKHVDSYFLWCRETAVSNDMRGVGCD
ncbi:hypothetical protein HanXRQr2_Chr09g0363461 [Helianthus annuus]|uniref:Uncharacterized protein n=1 Tax=Helianthus annuus TaxID=4232 RepID=A0A9K3I2I9_HELAN|nr:hypothetical protein HanXRQr2_Chr09g0363441 [Helianthus annuus]KAF5788815.1 hypothetical protein HanXRQr2_Chr09g0363461 [Helianthus annuus]